MTKGRELDWKPKPPPAEIKKIKADMRLRATDPLPRCMAKNTRRAKKLGGVHLEPGHVCDECRCKFTAGHGTDHYGYGYCIYHDSSIHHKGHALDVAHAQRVAVQQGQPKEVYRYLTGLEHIDEIRESADAARGRHQLKEEIVVLKGMLQAVIKNLHTDGTPTAQEINAVANLTRTIGGLAKAELEITDSDYVHVDEVKTWLMRILRLIQERVEDVELQQDLLQELVNIPQPETGKKK